MNYNRCCCNKFAKKKKSRDKLLVISFNSGNIFSVIRDRMNLNCWQYFTNIFNKLLAICATMVNVTEDKITKYQIYYDDGVSELIDSSNLDTGIANNWWRSFLFNYIYIYMRLLEEIKNININIKHINKPKLVSFKLIAITK